MKKKNNPLIAGPDDAGKRLDRMLRQTLPHLALSGIYRLIRRGHIRVNGNKTTISYRVASGDRITVPDSVETPSVPDNVSQKANPSLLSSLTLFRNSHLIVLNKPYNMLVHGPASLSDLVVSDFKGGGRVSLSFHPGPVHRLDRNTTGLQVFSLSITGARTLSHAFRKRHVMKVYCGLVLGDIDRAYDWRDRLSRDRIQKKTMVIEDSVYEGTSHEAATTVIPLFSNGKTTLVLFLPHTGRTHQLRVQAAYHKHPFLGDKKYGGPFPPYRYLLHNVGLCFPSGILGIPPLVAPFDSFGQKTITTVYGDNALTYVYKKTRELMARKEENILL